ncbi:hypothetical protein HPP92_015500 [Vanilla planifolia]|uniref:Uncharacterized protein n=1 Tax=Vanilla planifolia TaxID=51239 RepID=A0A835QJU9_VANPL|nr:hypothetical protein HPP92_015500 [Vanilla planifolia]
MIMEKMSRALERAKILVGMEVDEEVPEEATSFFDDFNRQCTPLHFAEAVWICRLLGCWSSVCLYVNTCFLQPNQIWDNIYLRQFACSREHIIPYWAQTAIWYDA